MSSVHATFEVWWSPEENAFVAFVFTSEGRTGLDMGSTLMGALLTAVEKSER